MMWSLVACMVLTSGFCSVTAYAKTQAVEMSQTQYIVGDAEVLLDGEVASESSDAELPEPATGYELQTSAVVSEQEDAEIVSHELTLQKYKLTRESATATSDSGQVATGISWSYEDGTLTIQGSGAMPDYGSDTTIPWDNYRTSITQLVIGEGITVIGKQTFYNHTALTQVSFPITLQEIKEAAFYKCGLLESVQLSATTTTIGSGAFADCTALDTFVAPGLTALSSYMLQRTKLTAFEVGKNVTDINYLAFWDADIGTYTVAAGNSAYTAVGGVLFTDNGKTLFQYPQGAEATSYKVPSTCETIGKYAFAYTNLKSVDFSGVKTLQDGAFYYSGLEGALNIPDSVTTLDENFVFEGITGITSVKFGAGLKKTAYRTFEGCTGITTIDFGNTLEYLGMRTFLGCNGLTSVTLPDRMTEWGGSVFNSCANLETFTARNLKAVVYADFAQCYKLKTVNLGSVEKIHRQAFTSCTALTEITLPSTIQWVDENAFPTTVKITCQNSELVPYGNNGWHYEDSVIISGMRDYENAFAVLTIVNQQRTANGIGKLKMDASLLDTAMVRAEEQSVLFAHTRPDGSSCFSANSLMVAENIAIGDSTAASVMNSWMNSEGHAANILNSSYTSIGIGCYLINGTYTWVQVFGDNSISADCAKPANVATTPTIGIATDTFSEAITTGGIVFGSVERYTYSFEVGWDKSSLTAGSTTQATMYLVNPGFSSLRVPLINEVEWSSGNSGIATISSTGMVQAVANGSANITGKTRYYSASKTLVVKGTNKAQTVSGTDKSGNPIYETKFSVTKVKKLRLKAAKKKLKLTWKKNSQVSGYQIQYSTSKTFAKKKTKTKYVKATANSVVLKNLKKHKKYYVRIRSYIKYYDANQNVKKAYSKWVKGTKKTK